MSPSRKKRCFSSSLNIHSFILSILLLISPGWILMAWCQMIILFSMCPLWPQILCKRKTISSFDIFSISSFVICSNRPHKMFLRSNIFRSNPHEFCEYDGETCIQCSNSPLSLFHDQIQYFYFCVRIRCRHNMIIICLFAVGGSLIWFAGCGIAASYLLQLHRQWTFIQEQHFPHLSCKLTRVAELINHHSYSVYSVKSKHSGTKSLADGVCLFPLSVLLFRQRWRKYLDYYLLLWKLCSNSKRGLWLLSAPNLFSPISKSGNLESHDNLTITSELKGTEKSTVLERLLFHMKPSSENPR